MKRKLFTFFIALFVAASSYSFETFASRQALDIPDNSAIRGRYKNLILEPLGLLAEPVDEIHYNRINGKSVRVRTMRQNSALYAVFANEFQSEFPIAGAGNYIIKQDEQTGVMVQAKIFFQNDSGSFVRLFPHPNQSLMDVYLFGKPIHRDVVVPVPLETLVLKPFSRIVDMTSRLVSWSTILPPARRQEDEVLSHMVNKLRVRLPELSDSDDGAMDRDGTFRFIEDLTENLASGFNCSGFAKWVVDGIYGKIAGEFLDIEMLKIKHPLLRGNRWSEQYEDQRDPYFGLDWSRNLATSILSKTSGGEAPSESSDVRDIPHFTYIEDVGFPIDDLLLGLYLLSIQEPGFFYLGSVNQSFGRGPVLRQHVHVVVLFPYFAQDGTFTVSVMERNLETNIQSLKHRYPGDFIHLVRILGSYQFSPPSFTP